MTSQLRHMYQYEDFPSGLEIGVMYEYLSRKKTKCYCLYGIYLYTMGFLQEMFNKANKQTKNAHCQSWETPINFVAFWLVEGIIIKKVLKIWLVNFWHWRATHFSATWQLCEFSFTAGFVNENLVFFLFENAFIQCSPFWILHLVAECSIERAIFV